MGLTFRKSARIGPFRVNVSKSGIGAYVGGRGYRTGISARGRRYTTFSIPGTGIGYRTTHTNKGAGCVLVACMILGSAATIIGALSW